MSSERRPVVVAGIAVAVMGPALGALPVAPRGCRWPRVKCCTSVPLAELSHAHTSLVPAGAITPRSVLSPVPVFEFRVVRRKC